MTVKLTAGNIGLGDRRRQPLVEVRVDNLHWHEVGKHIGRTIPHTDPQPQIVLPAQIHPQVKGTRQPGVGTINHTDIIRVYAGYPSLKTPGHTCADVAEAPEPPEQLRKTE